MNPSRSLVPDLVVLQAFESAARHGNFTRAAAELNLTQSAISRQVKTLEEQLGTLLFERIRQRAVLSDAGRQLLPSVRKLLTQAEDMVLRARAGADGSDILSIATLPTFGSRWLIPRLQDFLDRNPGVAVDIASRAAPFDLEAEDIDLAIHYGQPVWPNATCTYLCSEVILPVASPRLLAARSIRDPGDLSLAPLLHLATRPKLWAEWFERHGFNGGQAYRGNRFDQFAMIIEATLRGLGVSLLPLYLIEDEIAADRLRIVFDRPLTTDNSYYVVLPEGKRDSPLARAFQVWLLDNVSAR